MDYRICGGGQLRRPRSGCDCSTYCQAASVEPTLDSSRKIHNGQTMLIGIIGGALSLAILFASHPLTFPLFLIAAAVAGSYFVAMAFARCSPGQIGSILSSQPRRVAHWGSLRSSSSTFQIENTPSLPLGADISGTMHGERLFVEGTVSSAAGRRVAGALVEVWQADADGFYDVQRSELADPALRARFRANEEGRFHFWTILPAKYPIPDDGPVGDLLKATARHPWRPAHVHFMIAADGFETLVTHVFVAGGEYLDSDAVFGVKDSLIREFTNEAPGRAPDGTEVSSAWRKLSYDFGLKPAEDVKLPADRETGNGRHS